jgi:predicted nucleic acid-binding protein
MLEIFLWGSVFCYAYFINLDTLRFFYGVLHSATRTLSILTRWEFFYGVLYSATRTLSILTRWEFFYGVLYSAKRTLSTLTCWEFLGGSAFCYAYFINLDMLEFFYGVLHSATRTLSTLTRWEFFYGALHSATRTLSTLTCSEFFMGFCFLLRVLYQPWHVGKPNLLSGIFIACIIWDVWSAKCLVSICLW